MTNLRKITETLIHNRKKTLLVLILSSLITQSLFLVIMGDAVQSARPNDYFNYYKPGAENMLRGKGFVDDDGELITRFSPGYPVYLLAPLSLSKLTGISDLALVRTFSVLTSIFSMLAFFYCVTLIFSTRIAFYSSILWITYPFHIWFIKNPASEVPFFLFFFAALGVYFLAMKNNKALYHCLSGILFGCTALIRPIALLLGGIAAIGIFYLEKHSSKIRIKHATLIMLGFFIAILPWELFVYNKTEEFIPISKGGPVTMTMGFSYAVKEYVPGIIASVPDDVLSLMHRIRDKEDLTNIADVLSYFGQELMDTPIPFIKLIYLKTVRVWYATNVMWYENYILLIQLGYFLLIVPGIALAFRNSKDRIRVILFMLCIVFYFWGMAFLTVSILRYMVPVMAILLIFSAITVDKLIHQHSS